MALYAFDGTWNDSRSPDRNPVLDTNVQRFHTVYNGANRYYLDGVGSRGGVVGKYLGGAAPQPAPATEPAPGTTVSILANDPRITTVDGVQEGRWCGAMWCSFAGTDVKLIGNTGPACGLADIYTPRRT